MTAEDIAAFRAAGIEEIVVAVLAEDDVEENAAATRILRTVEGAILLRSVGVTG